ncbi:hypothetical protein BT96DRAFT_1008415 [Gymnopus androsaceus JB14]|uniref:Uncharacterized protein n=1 Tax=Gymnopus androsaceus JB14 TaxID=1447944 RepID=A0A6A4GF89_9AGAR|nr:hypothetical protein BT96DRAFT_1008415 [Gymnopus androsaceus JB14]
MEETEEISKLNDEDVNEAALKLDLSNLGANISISLKSDVLGPAPKSDQIILAFTLNSLTTTYASILQCSAILASSIIFSGLSSPCSTLGGILPHLPPQFNPYH